jgi:small subunit ribosomal protein S17
MKERKTKKPEEKVSKSLAGQATCKDKDCHIHGTLKTHGRIFQGKVIRKFNKRVTIEFERSVYVRKYERYASFKTKIHARLPKCMDDQIKIGDYIKVQECRPLSKIIHFVVIEKIKQTEGEKEK